MKKLFLSCALLLIALGSQAAEWQQAEEQYRQGRFSAALTDYETLLKTYPNDPFLYYNIGNCYFKMNSKGLAIANYYRAFRLNPRDKDIRYNLTLALQASGEQFIAQDMPELLHKAFFWFTPEELKGIVFAAFWLTCIVCTVWLVKRRLGFLAVLSMGILAVLGLWWLWASRIYAEPLAVVAAPVAELRSGPGANFPASANISQGGLVTIEDHKDSWVEVVVKSQGLKGWMESASLEKI